MDEPTTSAPTTTTIGDAAASLALADSSSATPEATPQTETPAPTATTSAAAEPQAPESASTDPKGEPPKWRWQDILANARETSAKEAEARLRQEYESRLKPYEGVDEHTLNGYRVLRAAERGDLQAQQHIAQVNPSLAQAMGWMKSAGADPEPEADLQSGDGTLVYSAPQLRKWQEWNKRQLLAEVRQEMQPLQRTAQQQQQRDAQAQAHTEASQAIASFASDPDFTPENRKACAEEIGKDARLSALADRDPAAALEIAWSRVHRAKVLPRRDAETEEKVRANLQQRAVAGTTNPGAASTSAPPNMIGNARAALEYASSVVGAA